MVKYRFSPLLQYGLFKNMFSGQAVYLIFVFFWFYICLLSIPVAVTNVGFDNIFSRTRINKKNFFKGFFISSAISRVYTIWFGRNVLHQNNAFRPLVYLDEILFSTFGVDLALFVDLTIILEGSIPFGPNLIYRNSSWT